MERDAYARKRASPAGWRKDCDTSIRVKGIDETKIAANTIVLSIHPLRAAVIHASRQGWV